MPLSTQLTRPFALPDQPHLAVLAISGPSDESRIEIALANLRKRHIRLTVSENVHTRGPRGYLAGDDETRARAINRALADPRFDGFLFTRGGYGAMRILDDIDYELIASRPRPIIGYSDLTALHQAVAVKAGVTTFHGPMLNTDFHDGLSREIDAWMWRLLRGERTGPFGFERSCTLVPGVAEGVLFGGCLALTTALIGTPYDFWVDDGIWFWEDVAEPLYRIDRMLTHLRLSGRFRSLRGMMVGQLRECGDGRPEELDALLLEFAGDLGIPVVRGLPFGHYGNNLMLPIGQTIQLDSTSGRLALLDHVVQRGEI